MQTDKAFSLALGIDIGGTKIAYAAVDNFGSIKGEIKKTQTPKTKEEIETVLKNIISEFENNVDFIAIATAGAVNNENTKVIGSTANLAKDYQTIDFLKLSKKRVFIENDANCASWAEHKIGASKGCNNSVMLTLGTGVGGGIIINNKLLKGKSGAAGEMHFSLSRENKRQCTCGNFDCFEIYASGNGLRLTGVEIFKDENITTYDIIEKAKLKDEKALLALNTWQKDITAGIVGLANLFDPECFVLSGSMEQFCNTQEIEKEVNKKILCPEVKVFHAEMKNNAGLIGAVLLGYDLIKSEA